MNAPRELHSVPTASDIRLLDIGLLVPDESNERKTLVGLSDLAESIQAMGVVEPPTVEPLNDGRYRIITGHRRVAAAEKAGLSAIEVIVRQSSMDHIRRLKSLVSNLQKADVPTIELARAIRIFLEQNYEYSASSVAKLLGKHPTWLSQLLKILDLPEDVLLKVEASQLNLSTDALSKIARQKDSTLQRRLVDEALSGATTRQIRNAIPKREVNNSTKRDAARQRVVIDLPSNARVIIESPEHLDEERKQDHLRKALEILQEDCKR